MASRAPSFLAYCESIHEVLGGNISALRAVINYANTLEKLKTKYPLLALLFRRKDSPFINLDLHTDPWKVHRSNYIDLNKPHTSESIERKTEFIFYNSWKKLVIENLHEERMEILTKQTERL